MKRTGQIVTAFFAAAVAVPTFAGPIQFFSDDGWTQFNDKPTTEDGEVAPGAGGQPFDAEYLFFKQDGATLSIGLQTGFDVVDGHYRHSDNKDYYAGDLALSFDGDVTIGSASTYEFGFDFGQYTESYYNTPGAIDFTDGSGVDPAGLYAVSLWSNDIYPGHASSNPYAIDKVSDAFGGATSAGKVGDSYYRIVSFDMTGLDISQVNAHWTMSCGNDNINGSFTVPEPESLAIILMGFLSVGFASARRRQLRNRTAA